VLLDAVKQHVAAENSSKNIVLDETICIYVNVDLPFKRRI